MIFCDIEDIVRFFFFFFFFFGGGGGGGGWFVGYWLGLVLCSHLRVIRLVFCFHLYFVFRLF